MLSRFQRQCKEAGRSRSEYVSSAHGRHVRVLLVHCPSSSRCSSTCSPRPNAWTSSKPTRRSGRSLSAPTPSRRADETWRSRSSTEESTSTPSERYRPTTHHTNTAAAARLTVNAAHVITVAVTALDGRLTAASFRRSVLCRSLHSEHTPHLTSPQQQHAVSTRVCGWAAALRRAHDSSIVRIRHAVNG